MSLLTRFIKIRKLGSGSYGEVILCKYLVPDTLVAVKLITKTDFERKSELEKIKNELYLHNKLSHPNIIKCFGIYETKEEACIVMEYMENGDLHHYINSYSFCRMTVQKIFKQIVAGLEYLHDNDIIHRDIKPENIVLTRTLTVKLIDFGFAVEYKDRNKYRHGSPAYAAPEIVMKLEFGYPIDIWSLGCVLYALVYRHSAFHGEDLKDLYRNIVKKSPKISDIHNCHLNLVIMGMLTVNPKKRYSIAQIKSNAWFKMEFLPLKKFRVDKEWRDSKEALELVRKRSEIKF